MSEHMEVWPFLPVLTCLRLRCSVSLAFAHQSVICTPVSVENLQVLLAMTPQLLSSCLYLDNPLPLLIPMF
jgi:hypothetical protein